MQANKDSGETLLHIAGLKMHFRSPRASLSARSAIKAVTDQRDLYRGETLGLVGESGCGPPPGVRFFSSMPDRGQVVFEGKGSRRLG
jgi:ABC-type glutathione transport system ATPase component